MGEMEAASVAKAVEKTVLRANGDNTAIAGSYVQARSARAASCLGDNEQHPGKTFFLQSVDFNIGYQTFFSAYKPVRKVSLRSGVVPHFSGRAPPYYVHLIS
ncbi:hypothetical protein DN752_06110 [Echinicola strongylocentroti]|uniref:Uncharacterized protein n=2 Tax=Echinicola strongylocentroti TaxID=1795355 RepID=A0A2Z4IGX5_9BACT|nr:hypothetical protein DN752_06110 [Echinicola strongylocentroti]